MDPGILLSLRDTGRSTENIIIANPQEPDGGGGRKQKKSATGRTSTITSYFYTTAGEAKETNGSKSLHMVLTLPLLQTDGLGSVATFHNSRCILRSMFQFKQILREQCGQLIFS